MNGHRLESDSELRRLLAGVRTVAVVGLSPRPDRPSHGVAAYLQRAGYRVIPVHPAGGMILGEAVYSSLLDVPDELHPDLVDVFRRPEALPGLLPDVQAVGPRALWLQLGVTHAATEARALAAGMDLVVDRCLAVEHRRLLGR